MRGWVVYTMLDLNKIDLEDRRDQEYYTTEDIIIPKGTRIENWSNQQKADNNRFEMNVGFGKDSCFPFRLYPRELEDIIVNNPNLITDKEIL